jgi:hypothetical protein
MMASASFRNSSDNKAILEKSGWEPTVFLKDGNRCVDLCEVAWAAFVQMIRWSHHHPLCPSRMASGVWARHSTTVRCSCCCVMG